MAAAVDPFTGSAAALPQAGGVMRLGILGCANIARKNAMSASLARNVRVVAVASRSAAKAEAWVASLNLPGTVRTYGAYSELLEDADVDAVYIPLPTTMHLEWVVKAADAKKHVLCEKPVAMNVEELLAIIGACDRNGVQWMDGTMFMHHERTLRLRELLTHPTTGDVVRVSAAFCFHGDASFFESNIRADASADPLGAVGDLLWYCARLGLVAHGFAWPHSVRVVSSRVMPNGVPLEADVVVAMDEAERVVMRFFCSFEQPFQESFEIYTAYPTPYMVSNGFPTSRPPLEGGDVPSDKVFRCNDFVIPDDPSEVSFEVETHGSFPFVDRVTRTMRRTETVRVANNSQERQMWEKFADIVLSNELEPRWKLYSLVTTAILDAAMIAIREGREVKLGPKPEWYTALHA